MKHHFQEYGKGRQSQLIVVFHPNEALYDVSSVHINGLRGLCFYLYVIQDIELPSVRIFLLTKSRYE